VHVRVSLCAWVRVQAVCLPGQGSMGLDAVVAVAGRVKAALLARGAARPGAPARPAGDAASQSVVHEVPSVPALVPPRPRTDMPAVVSSHAEHLVPARRGGGVLGQGVLTPAEQQAAFDAAVAALTVPDEHAALDEPGETLGTGVSSSSSCVCAACAGAVLCRVASAARAVAPRCYRFRSWLDGARWAVQERVGSRAVTLTLEPLRLDPAVGDFRLLSIPATLKMCRAVLTEAATVLAPRLATCTDVPRLMQVR
jgi:hypothetical protein